MNTSNNTPNRKTAVWIIILDFLMPLAILIGLTGIFRTTNLDRDISSHFFVPGEGWAYRHDQPWEALYEFGTMPAILVTVAALVVLIASLRVHKLKLYRKACILTTLLMLLGPGLIVNGIFKEYWGRPRPRNIQDFGGPRPFLKVWEKGSSRKDHSFPSGHASMGFFLMFPYFLLRKRSKTWAFFFLLLGIGAGLTMGMARIVQGGHFASDVLWSGGFVYLCGISLYYLLQLNQQPERFS